MTAPMKEITQAVARSLEASVSILTPYVETERAKREIKSVVLDLQSARKDHDTTGRPFGSTYRQKCLRRAVHRFRDAANAERLESEPMGWDERDRRMIVAEQLYCLATDCTKALQRIGQWQHRHALNRQDRVDAAFGKDE